MRSSREMPCPIVELAIPAHLTPQKNLGLRLLLARIIAGLSQVELGRKLSVSGDVVWRWENGVSVPDALMIVAIAEAVGQKPDCFRV